MSYFLICFFAVIFLFSAPSSSQVDEDDIFYAGFEAGNGGGATNLTLTGVTEIQQDGILRLTNDTSRLMGHAFYSKPLRFKNSTDGKAFSFSTSFVFAIVPEYPKLGGHGLAFTVATSKDLKALPSQYLGLFNASDIGNFTNHVLAVEFDTVQDFEFGDINDNHVGVDINSMTSNASASAAYFAANGSKLDLNLKCGKSIKAWIDYDSVLGLLNVTISPFSSKPRSPILSFPVDLSPIIQEYMYIGFSSSTGLLASSHYITGWSFKMSGQARELDLSSLPSLPGPKKNHRNLAIAVTVSSIILTAAAVVMAICVIRKIKNAEVIEQWELEIGPHRYSYKELKQATKGFREKELLGQGGFGQVFKGTLPNSKTQVAVKRISHESKQGLREFVAEIASIGRLRHRNLVQLLGWCRRGGELLLVYDFMANGSLDSFLFEEPKMVLSWEQRFKIIKDVAAGLLYLHEGYEQVVVHRDVKASNVLLDGELCGKLGDFGLARLHEHGSNPGTTRVVGTLGYLAPELPRTGKATASSDVYAFGALLLEVACGRRPIEPKASPEELVLVDWVWDRFRTERLLDAVDTRLNGEFDESEVAMVLKLGLMCSSNGAAARPDMRQVVRYLNREVEVPENLRAPRDFTGEKVECSIDVEGFDNLLCSFASSSFEKNTYPFSENGQVGVSFASLSTSPLSLLHTR